MSTKTLVLAEKPSAAKAIAKALGRFDHRDGVFENGDYVIVNALGHLYETVEPHVYDERFKRWSLDTLPIIPEVFRYAPAPKKDKGLIKTIKAQLARSDVGRVIIATDAGREGELIAREILRELKCKKPLFRMWTSSMQDDAIRREIEHARPASDFDRVYAAAMARQQADWLVGINATRAFTVALGELNSLGRIQTPVLAIICAREAARRAFVPEAYWTISAQFKHANGTYTGAWFDPVAPVQAGGDDAEEDESPEEEEAGGKGKKAAKKAPEAGRSQRIMSNDRAYEILKKVKGGTGTIESWDRKPSKSPPPQLFSLTELQQAANRKFGWPSKKTDDVAQELYEAKAITYPRTESRHLSEDMEAEVRATLALLAGAGHVSFDPARVTVDVRDKRVFDNSKLTDHYALIPDRSVPTSATPDQLKLYELVVRQFVAAFYPDYETDVTRLVTLVAGERFETTGRIVVDAGWREILGGLSGDEELPSLKMGDQAACIKQTLDEKKTSPPPNYTEDTLLGDMKSVAKFVTDARLKKILRATAGLGQTSTRSTVIETLISRSFIVRKGKNLLPTEKGLKLISIVGGERIASPEYTAYWEQQLEAVATGELPGSDEFMAGIRIYTQEIINTATKHLQHAVATGGVMDTKAVGKCPDCGADVTETPKAFSCSAYKATGCKFALWKSSPQRLGRKGELTEKEAVALLAEKEIELKGLVSKRTNKPYDCKGRLAKDANYGWQISLIFEDR